MSHRFIIHNRFIPFSSFYAINICGLIFVRKGIHLSARELNHERIHTRQQLEMLFVFFYVWYLAEWLIKICLYRNRIKAYRNISFEREAYKHMNNLNYLKHRKHFAWMKHLR